MTMECKWCGRIRFDEAPFGLPDSVSLCLSSDDQQENACRIYELQAEVERLHAAGHEKDTQIVGWRNKAAMYQTEVERLRTLLSEWIAEADSGELDGVDLELMVMTDDALKPRGEEE